MNHRSLEMPNQSENKQKSNDNKINSNPLANTPKNEKNSKNSSLSAQSFGRSKGDKIKDLRNRLLQLESDSFRQEKSLKKDKSVEIIGTDLENDEVASKVFSSDLSPACRGDEEEVQIMFPKNKHKSTDRNKIFPISEQSKEDNSRSMMSKDSSNPGVFPRVNKKHSDQID